MRLHKQLVAVLDSFKLTFNNPQFTGDGFIAHETIHNGRPQITNKNVLLNNVTLIDMFPASDGYERRIVAQFPFSSKP